MQIKQHSLKSRDKSIILFTTLPFWSWRTSIFWFVRNLKKCILGSLGSTGKATLNCFKMQQKVLPAAANNCLSGVICVALAVFILEDALSVWTNLGKHSLFVGLYVSTIKTGTRRIIRVDELPSFVRRSSRKTEDSSSRRIMRLVPVFRLETCNSTNNECLPKFVQTDNASSSIKTAIDLLIDNS